MPLFVDLAQIYALFVTGRSGHSGNRTQTISVQTSWTAVVIWPIKYLLQELNSLRIGCKPTALPMS
jgi:hypothetical protein